MLYECHRVEVRVDWVPGHAGIIGNKAVRTLASESENDRSIPDSEIVPAPDDPDQASRISAAKQD